MIYAFYINYLNIGNADNVGKLLFKYFAYIFAFFCFESLLSLFVLLELSYLIYLTPVGMKFIKKCQYAFKHIGVPVIICLVIKYYLTINFPYVKGYSYQFSFKAHALLQFIYFTINLDYFKVRWATGVFMILAQFLILIVRIRMIGIKQFLKSDFVILFFYVLSAAYYYLIMDYRASRAVAGQIYFYWGFIVVAYLNIIFIQYKDNFVNVILKNVIKYLLPIVFLIHQGYVFSVKWQDRKAYLENGEKLVQMVEAHHFNEGPLIFHRSQALENLATKVGWNMFIVEDIQGFIRHNISAEYFKNIKIIMN